MKKHRKVTYYDWKLYKTIATAFESFRENENMRKKLEQHNLYPYNYVDKRTAGFSFVDVLVRMSDEET